MGALACGGRCGNLRLSALVRATTTEHRIHSDTRPGWRRRAGIVYEIVLVRLRRLGARLRRKGGESSHLTTSRLAHPLVHLVPTRTLAGAGRYAPVPRTGGARLGEGLLLADPAGRRRQVLPNATTRRRVTDTHAKPLVWQLRDCETPRCHWSGETSRYRNSISGL